MAEITLKENYINGPVEDLLTAIGEATGELIEWERQYIVRTDSARVTLALESLFGSAGSTLGKGATVERPASYKVKKKPAGELREIKIWEVFENGKSVEKITLTDKNIRLTAGQFKSGTLLRHPKAGWQRVTGEYGHGQGMEPLTAEQVRELGGQHETEPA